MEGIFNIDKPLGITSHDVVNRLRRVCGTRRVGHAGTLDPLATGVLITAVGRATRLIEYIVGRPKTYLATVRLGETTLTYDAESEVVETRPLPAGLTAAVLDQTLNLFRGEIQQVPPMYSAIKKDGQPLYKLARAGKEVEREARPVAIYKLELLTWQAPELELRVICSAGTYIRSLAHDLGEEMGCGGHLSHLRRTAVGAFTEAASVSLDALTADNAADFLLPADLAVEHLPQLTLTQDEEGALANGRFIARQPMHPEAELVRAYTSDGRFMGIATRRQQQWQPKKVFI